MKDREIFEKPRNLCCFEFISFAILFGLFSRGFVNSSQVSQFAKRGFKYSKLERPKAHLKSRMAQKNKTNIMKMIHTHLFLPFIHDYHSVRRERKSGRWMSPRSRDRAGRTKWRRERRHKLLRLPGFLCKATEKKVANM